MLGLWSAEGPGLLYCKPPPATTRTRGTLVGAYLQGELNSSWLGNSFRIWDFSPLHHLALRSPKGWMDAAIDGHGLTV